MTNHNINSKTKRVIRSKKGDKCEDCGKLNGSPNKPEERLQIHHKKLRVDGGSSKVSNLKLLCKECHDKAHKKCYITRLSKNLYGANEKW